MANKKNLPNIPIYIGDWEKDCNALSLESEMAWMKIIFKMWTNGRESVYKIPTKSLQILWKSPAEKVDEIIEELKFNNICEISVSTGGVEFKSRRFEKENEISEIRSEAVSNRRDRSKKTKLKQQKAYKTLQNHDNDHDYENESEDVNKNKTEKEKGGVGEKTELTKPEGVKIDFENIIKIFNEVCPNLPKVQKITKTRKSAINARIKDYGLKDIGIVFQKVSQSNFLNGENDRGWNADFDWIMNPNNFIKILEGKYNGKPKQQVAGKAQAGGSDELRRKTAERLGLIQS